MRRSSSPSSPGSARKRQRLSSPTYEEHFPITQEELRAFDEAEKQLSQGAPVVPSQSRSLPSEEMSNHRPRRWSHSGVERGEATMAEDWSSSSPPAPPQTTQDRAADDDFFSTSLRSGGFVSAAVMSSRPLTSSSKFSGFTSAVGLPSENRTPSQLLFTEGFASAATVKVASESRLNEDDEASALAPPALAKFGGFGPASALPMRHEDAYDDNGPSSPSEPLQPNYDSWFDSDLSALPPDASITFESARAMIAPLNPNDTTGHRPSLAVFSSGLKQLHAPSLEEPTNIPAQFTIGFASAAQVGFGSAAALNGGKSSWTAPSAEALARAALRMKQWEAEEASAGAALESSHDVENDPPAADPSPSISRPPPLPPASSSFQTPLRPALRPMENSGFSPAQILDTPLALKTKTTTHYTTVGGIQIKNTHFKSPLINRQPRSNPDPLARPGSSLKSVKASGVGFGLASGSKLPPAFPPDLTGVSAVTAVASTTPFRPMQLNPTSPGKGKALGMTPRRVSGIRPMGKSKFSTPFKPGMAPGEPARAQLELTQKTKVDAFAQTPSRTLVYATPSSKGKGKAKKEYRFFDLSPVSGRKTLASSGLRPRSYTVEELCDMDINVEELRQMQPLNAIYYTFHSPVPSTESEKPQSPLQLGPEAALARLKDLGCTLATLEWVTNHYGLILWKLAGMVCLEPKSERDPSTKRWCWSEVIRQLRYRYERELNGGSRPALRLISTEDAPASCPMVLCVSGILSCASGMVTKNGVILDSHPELEVTDGWYRLRAKVDLPLARAVRRGLITVGTKFAVSGARLSGDRKEPCEILDAYDSTQLEFSGNATHLAPWHAKLGFVKEPFIATMDSLSGDGGIVPAMDVTIVKAYPIGYSEFIRNDDGSTTKIGPRDEKEELKAHDQWLIKRDKAIVKIRMDLEKNIQLLEKTVDRLHGIAGPRFDEKSKRDDPLPDYVEDLYTEMMEDCPRPSQMFDRLTYEDAGWLRIHMLDQIRMAKERFNEDIEREIQYTCPPRNVRDFRVVVAKDARWRRHEPTRAAQITLWDPLRMVFSEGGTPGDIREGQRFMVTNLHPNQPNAWMAPGPEAMIYLISKKNTRWTNIKHTTRC